MPQMTPNDVLAFWREAGRDRWFRGGEAFDRACIDRFRDVWEDAAAGRLDAWANSPDGALALVLLLDQMPRNMFRATPRAYASDAKAREVAEAAIAAGHDTEVEPALRQFFYLPFMHAESIEAQDLCVALYEAMGDADSLKWARHHRDIVARFGRFPHRNAVLGRETTPQEREWLASEDAFKG
ncbi:DUF924 domain-containing protein [Alsobacter sp. SYSU M60028]|uniref:DUF924 domain-containing protein n=1 Tax=Alsobacter ponti TaxID=2962936 RepID=A0ABT1L7J7_9HYPH|nr:DUF924 family protein [Alsobacter ponti]MCP8936973.1 DUF924 domain-containing protein [Alsobacter ponti]